MNVVSIISKFIADETKALVCSATYKMVQPKHTSEAIKKALHKAA